MIEKERLEELIKQGATIWHDDYGEIELNATSCEIAEVRSITGVHLQFVLCFEYECNNQKHWGEFDIQELEENVENAKWHYEMDCARIERLELPNWEEKNCIIYTFYSPIKKGGQQYEFRLFKGGNITIWRTDDMYKVFNESATKENYTIACRKAKELFLGE